MTRSRCGALLTNLPRWAELKTPGSLATRPVSSLAQYDTTVLLIQRQDRLLPCPGADTRLEQGDTLFVVGRREKLLEVASLP